MLRAETPLSFLIGPNGPPKIILAEIGPEDVDEDQFAIGALPEEEVAEPLLTGGPYDEVRI